jgi:hypothetical protein
MAMTFRVSRPRRACTCKPKPQAPPTVATASPVTLTEREVVTIIRRLTTPATPDLRAALQKAAEKPAKPIRLSRQAQAAQRETRLRAALRVKEVQ